VLLVEEGATSRCLDLRMPAELESQIDALERWVCAQLNDRGGQLNWSALPRQLSSSGALLKQGLASHEQARRNSRASAVSLGLGRLMQQPEFERSESLRPLLELVELEPQQVLRSDAVLSRGGVWIGREHPHPALHHCSVVQASYGNRSGGVGQVALIGPMRMAYATARSAVEAVAAYLDRLLR
jgi:heat-inducible transcriptional repressor